MHLRSITAWFAIMLLAIANGAVREVLMSPFLGQQAAHVLSTIILCLLIVLVAWLSIGWIAPPDERGAIAVGLTWVALTLAFEFLAGHFLFGAPWEELLADYNLLEGRIWPLVPLTTFFAPPGAYRLRLRTHR